MMPSRLVLVLALVAAWTTGFTSARSTTVKDDIAFPHARHARLFTSCAACHGGIERGDATTRFPAPAVCASCHNGTDAKVVSWSVPARRASNLKFDHPSHTRLSNAAGDRLSCTTCHGDGPAPSTMLVTRPRPETCIGCHAHPAPSHFAPTSPCATCHAPLAAARELSDSAVAALPRPQSHAAADWIPGHGAMARETPASCAMCHARESCTRCHVNAAALPTIAALGTDARVAKVVRGKAAVYPLPATHQQSDFNARHGLLAKAGIQSCANCHAQAGCLACHTGSLGARVINALPVARPGGVSGVQLRREPRRAPPAWPDANTPRTAARPLSGVIVQADAQGHADSAALTVRVHASDWVRTHGPPAATGRLDCAGCHQQSFCTACHQGAGERRFHPFNFVARHPSEAYALEARCTSCHNAQTFCRSCHQQWAGIAAGSRRRSGTAHAGNPLWLLQHGEAARRGMNSCAGCHQQTDCMQCHSTLAGRINPHGPDFNAAAMQKRNPTLCAYCHVRTPSR